MLDDAELTPLQVIDPTEVPQPRVDPRYLDAWPDRPIRDILRERAGRLKIIRKDPKALAAAKVFYKTHPVEFIEDWLFTYDPRRDGAKFIPFILFQKQKDFIHWLNDRFEGRQDGIAEKSRDMGATWLCVAWSVWRFLFHGGVKVGFGSRKEELVDKLGDNDSIFEKIRLVLRRLPREFKPKGWNVRIHDNHLKLINPENGSTITGEGGDNIGRGGRSSIYFLDEAAHIAHPQAVDAALDDNSDCKISISTPNGTGNTFYKKRMSGKFAVFTFHWKDHPCKTPEWYEEQKRLRDPQNLAQEIDIDYEASLEGITIPSAWVRAARGLKIARGMGNRIAGLDVGGGSDLSVFVVRHGPKVEVPIHWNDPDLINTADNAAALTRKHNAEYLNYDVFGIGQGVMSKLKRIADVRSRGINVGDKPTKARWADNKSSVEKFQNLKAELWWVLRDAIHKTYQYVNGVADYPADELISLPEHDQLCSELSLPRWFLTPAGKIQIETKEQLKKRGVKSPDFADALVLTFATTNRGVKAREVKGMY